MSDPCQVDFYLLARPGLDARRMACRLALMAWERGLHSIVLTESDDHAAQLDTLMWESPAERFLPHEHRQEPTAAEPANHVPVLITGMSCLQEESSAATPLNQYEVVINLCAQPVPDPSRFKRLLEIVPHENEAMQASREKFKYYR